MRKKYGVTLAALALVCLLFAACPTEHKFELDVREALWGIPPFSGYVDGEQFGYRSTVTVRLYLDGGIIVDAVIDPSRESTGFWEGLPAPARERIVASNSMNITLDGLGGPTTTRAVIQAGRNALLEIPGVTEADL